MTTSASTDQRTVLKSALWSVALVAPVLAVIAFFTFGARGVLASIAGSALALVNLWAVARIVRGLVEEARLRSRWSLLALFKMIALIGTVFALVASGLPVLAVAIGYAAMPIGILIGQLWAPAPADDDAAPHKG
ncbi:MAG TPA: hypothetical protein VM686_20730 [Polyangiaceae bacterium]|nr:hypothetical protein [Polyangiaceae bacterium]